MSQIQDDHMIHRGHCVFDTSLVVDGNLYLLDDHLYRLQESADKVKPPAAYTLLWIPQLLNAPALPSSALRMRVRALQTLLAAEMHTTHRKQPRIGFDHTAGVSSISVRRCLTATTFSSSSHLRGPPAGFRKQ